MAYTFLAELLPWLERYEKERRTQDDIRDFAHWILAQEDSKNYEAMVKKPYKNGNPQGDMRGQIAQLLYLMSKYFKFYMRKNLEEMSGPDDFGFLASLVMGPPLRKNELIEQNTMEFSSGMEVIRRLEVQEYIYSESDPVDLRAKLVHITPKGRAYFMSLLPRMQEVGEIAMGRLGEEEQATLLQLLLKLQDFHKPIFKEAKKQNFKTIKETYMF